MGRVRPLFAAPFQQSALLKSIQHDLKQARLRPVFQQAGAKLAQDREVETVIGQFQAEHVFPVQPPTHRVCCLAIG